VFVSYKLAALTVRADVQSKTESVIEIDEIDVTARMGSARLLSLLKPIMETRSILSKIM
jgi:hypothetical protein